MFVPEAPFAASDSVAIAFHSRAPERERHGLYSPRQWLQFFSGPGSSLRREAGNIATHSDSSFRALGHLEGSAGQFLASQEGGMSFSAAFLYDSLR